MFTAQLLAPFIKSMMVWVFLPVVLLGSCRTQYPGEVPTSIEGVRISAHRGGPTEEYPENTLEAIVNTAGQIRGVMVEFDVRSTRDGGLVLLHDHTLDRTTTLSGRVSETLYAEVEEARIRTEKGVTDMAVPTLKQVFQWAKNRPVYMSVDLKERDLYREVVDLIKKEGVLDQTEIITYSKEEAIRVHAYASDVHLSMSIGSVEVLEEVIKAPIIFSKVAAYTGGTIKDTALYNRLKKKGITVTLGTMGNLDNKAKVKGYELFKEWSKLGIDRFATDIPFTVDSVLSEPKN